MDHYADGDMDLYTYQLSMGALSFSKSSLFCGDIIEDENEEQLIANICSETDLMLSEININIDNSLLNIVNCPSPSPKKTKKPSKSVKHRRQKRNEDPRISVLNIRSPVRGMDHDGSDSLHGEQLRQNRLMGDPTTAAVLAVAAVATAAAASTATCEDSDDQSPPSPSQPTLPPPSLPTPSPPSLPTPLPASQPTPPSLSSTDMFDTVSFLDSLNFKVSESQPSTPGDGNCMFHVLSDQSFFKDHFHARNLIVQNIYEMIEKQILFWDDSEPLSDWIESMMIPGTHGDSYALQVAANLMGRDILIVPSKGKKSANNPYGYLLIDSYTSSNLDPLCMLYFEEHVYGIGHYQSIRSVNNENFTKI